MNYARAISAGIIGALVMSAIMVMARAMGMTANLEMMLGTMTGLEPSTTAWILGFGMHLMAGAIFALIYAACFEFLFHRANWWIGATLGAVHTVLSGLFMGAVPMMHPLIPEQMDAPGLFMANVPYGVIAFTMLHLIYGAIVGAMYGYVRHPSPSGGIGLGRRAKA